MATARLQDLMLSLGLKTPLQRFAAISAVTGAGLVMAQPEAMFFQGVPRPMSAITKEQEAEVPPTMVPWWLASIGTGLVTASFL